MLLSIIVPVYNVERYLEECLSSIFGTQHPNEDFEVIVVNDGTPDNSMDIVRRYAAAHDNLHILEQANQGLSAARMNGLALAKGDYIWFVDSDDYLLPEWQSAVLQLLETDSPDLCISPLMWAYQNDSANRIDIRSEVPRRGIGKDYLQQHLFPIYAAPRYIIRRKLFDNTDLFFPDGLLHEDEYFGRVLLYEAKSAVILDAPVYVYRIREGSITTVPKIKSSVDILKIHELLMSYSESNVLAQDKKWFQKDALRLIRTGFTRNEKLFSTKEFKAFRRKNLKYILAEYRKYRRNLSVKEWLSDISLYICPKLHIRLYYLFEPLFNGK